LEGHDELGALFEAVEKVGDEIPDVFCVGTLEGELLAPYGGERERLGEGFVASEEEKKETSSSSSYCEELVKCDAALTFFASDFLVESLFDL